MPGAYAHIAVANQMRERVRHAPLSTATKAAVGSFLRYVELGALSPDYPYLCLKTGQARWADEMHYRHNAALLRHGVDGAGRLAGVDREKAMAWLLGFAAHMATDMTIHPIVEAKVGPYAQNKKAHRTCEMHQDAFIFPRILDVGETAYSGHFQDGVAKCHAADNEDLIDPVIGTLWQRMLQDTYTGQKPDEAPTPDAWHCGFRGVLGTMAKASRLVPVARHVVRDQGLLYPLSAEVEKQYVERLATPEGPMDYPALFIRACDNVLKVWQQIDQAWTTGRSPALEAMRDWDLDTGREVNSRRYVFWRNAA